jgi:hypothetical protein
VKEKTTQFPHTAFSSYFNKCRNHENFLCIYVGGHTNISKECTLLCVCAGQCISMSLYEHAQCIHGGIHTCVMYIQLRVCICACLYLQRSHVWQQVYVRQSVNVCIYVSACVCAWTFSCVCAHMHTRTHTHTHTHMECVKVPELINSLTWHYSDITLRGYFEKGCYHASQLAENFKRYGQIYMKILN